MMKHHKIRKKYHVYEFPDFCDQEKSYPNLVKMTLSQCGHLSLYYRPQMKEIFSIPKALPEEADFFVVPIVIHLNEPFPSHQDPRWQQAFRSLESDLKNLVLDRCPHFQEHKSRHIFFQVSDCDQVVPSIRDCIVFKDSPNKNMRILPLYFQTLLHQNWKCISEASLDISFQGTTNNNPLRKQMGPALNRAKQEGMKVYYKDAVRYFYFHDEKTRSQLRQELLNSINDAKFVMNPAGKGHSSPRLYETLQAGRIPVIVSDDIAMPLAMRIPWDRISVMVPQHDVLNTYRYVNEFQEKHSLEDSSNLAKEIFNRFFAPGCLFGFIENSLEDAEKEGLIS